MSDIAPPSNVGVGYVTFDLISDVNDSPDPDTDPDFIAPTGYLSFVRSVNVLRDPTAAPRPVSIASDVYTGQMIDGRLWAVDEDGTPLQPYVSLIANDDPDLNPSGTTYRVFYFLKGKNGKSLKIPDHEIVVPEGETIDLTVVGPVEDAQAIGVPAAEAAAAAAVAAAAAAAADAAAAQAALVDSESFVDTTGAALVGDADSELGGAVAAKIATGIETGAAVPLVEVAGVYPDRPAGVNVAVFVGATNPEAFMEDQDIWVNPAETPVTFEGVEAAAADPLSDLSTSIRSGQGAGEVVYLTAREMRADEGSPTESSVATTGGYGVPVWSLSADAHSGVSGLIRVPAGWTTAKLSLLWAHSTSSPDTAQRVRWRMNANMVTPGSLISAGATVSSDNNQAPPAYRTVSQHIPTTNNFPVTPGGLLRVGAIRMGDNVNDTFVGASLLIAAKVERLT